MASHVSKVPRPAPAQIAPRAVQPLSIIERIEVLAQPEQPWLVARLNRSAPQFPASRAEVGDVGLVELRSGS